MEPPAAALVAMAVPIATSPEDLHRMFARYGSIKSLRCVRDTSAKATKRAQVTYERPISLKLALRSEMLRPLDLRREDEKLGAKQALRRQQKQRTQSVSQTFAYVSSHVPSAGEKRSRSVEPWRVIPSAPIEGFDTRAASAMEAGQRTNTNSWLPPIVRSRVQGEQMDAVRASLKTERDKPRMRIDPETKQMVSRRDATAQELPDEMATMKDVSKSEHAGSDPSRARKMMKQALSKSYKERLRRYGTEWHKADNKKPRELGNGAHFLRPETTLPTPAARCRASLSFPSGGDRRQIE